MFVHFADLDRAFSPPHAFLDRWLASQLQVFREAFDDDVQQERSLRFYARDVGDAYVVKAELPGVPANALEVTVTGQVLKLRAARTPKVPEEFVAHRRERRAFELTRSLTLPARIDAERVTAEARDGVLSLTLPKAAEARPRSIAVKAG